MAALIFSILVICTAVFFYAQAEPTAAPPNNNMAMPLNAGVTGQTKEGGLTLNTAGATNGLIVFDGRVGIGTTTPSVKLEVSGGNVKFGSSIILSPIDQPSSPQAGQIYFSQTGKSIYYYNGTRWSSFYW